MPSSKGDVDSGWAWVILAGNFLSMICHACMMYGVGVIHVELLHQFRESDTYTSLAGSLFSSLTLFIGPIGTTLMNQYGCRVTMCIGALLIVAGFVATFLTKTLTTVILTYGLIAGVSRVSTAFGLLYLIGGFGYIMGPILAGLILDEGGTYELNFIICGVLYFSSTLLTCVCSTYLDTTAVHAGDKSISALQASGLIYGSSRVSVKPDDNNPFLKPVDTPLLVLSQE